MTTEMERYDRWVQQVRENPDYAAELAAIADKPEEIKDRFYRALAFGTAGLRGVLGLGTNRMNIYTVRQATQGLADYLCKSCKNPSAAIAYDSRNGSELFARETARVFAASGMKVYLYPELMPTPALSYAVRELSCDAGVVITASHNPARYNGYKAYGPDGAQLGPEAANCVMENMGRIDLFEGPALCDFDDALADGRIELLSEAFIQEYIDRVFEEALDHGVCEKADLKLVYTPLNGAGNRCVRTILRMAGVRDITVVPEQEHPDGNFPTCPYPNPEMPEALALGLALCEKTGADMLLATDPDADRAAVAVRSGSSYRVLSGNEVGVLLLDYICTARKKAGTMPKKPVAVKSIVSSKLADLVAREHGVEMVNVLTGFKFIGEVILKLEQKGEMERFIFGFEESCGYLSGGYARDKDAVDAALLLTEMASSCKLRGKTLVDLLDEIYARHGMHLSRVESFDFEGADGMKKMQAIMQNLREHPPAEIGGDAVVERADYDRSVRIKDSAAQAIDLPRSNVLEYTLANGCGVIVRPSGTEPKIKIYYALAAKTADEIERLWEKYSAACAAMVK